MKNILLLAITFSFANFLSLFSQTDSTNFENILIRGRVIGDNGEPMTGVLIKEIGTTNGTVTDYDGNFLIKIHKEGKIEITFSGYLSIVADSQYGSNLQVNIEKGLIEFCCFNHIPCHCATKIGQMKKLSEKNNCQFK